MLNIAYHQHVERLIYFSEGFRYQYQIEVQYKPKYYIKPQQKQDLTHVKVTIIDNQKDCLRQFEYDCKNFRVDNLLKRANQYFDIYGLIPNLKVTLDGLQGKTNSKA